MMVLSLVRFWLDIFMIIPCIGCCIFILNHFRVDRAFRQALNNHVIIAIIIFNQLTDGL
jgi:hypothetical protein